MAVDYCHQIMIDQLQVKKISVKTSQLAFGFFEKFGYRTIRVEQNYWGLGLDLYEMELLLQS